MKKRILTLAAIAAFFVPASNAQNMQPEKPVSMIRKGSISVGTEIGLVNLAMYRISPGQTDLLYNVRLNPSVGYFVNDHLMLSASVLGGVSQSFGYFTEKVRMNSVSLGMSVGGRYYFGKGLTRQGELKKLRFYGDAGVGIAQRWNKWTSASSGEVSKGTNGDLFANLGAGMNYFLAPNIAFETGVSYNRYFPGAGATDASLQINLGVRVFLHRK